MTMCKILPTASVISVLFIYSQLAAQVFTAFGVQFERLPVLKNTGMEYSSIAIIDVVHGKPRIKNITTEQHYPIVDTETRKFINNLIFIRDISDYQITFIVKVNPKLMNQYSEVSGDTIFLVYPSCPLINSCPVGNLRFSYVKEHGTSYLHIILAGLLHTNVYLESSADIYLERIFSDGKDSTVII